METAVLPPVDLTRPFLFALLTLVIFAWVSRELYWRNKDYESS